MKSRSSERPVIWPLEHLGKPVPTLQAEQVHEWPEEIGEVTDALVSFNSGDVLLHSGLHRDVFADPSSPSSRLSVATMLLYTAEGAVVAVEDANCGYGGTGRHTAQELLKVLGFADATLHGRLGIRHYPLVIEQGAFQLLCPTLPVGPSRSATSIVSDEMLAVLEPLGLGDEAHRLNPVSMWERLRERARAREYAQLPTDRQPRFGDPWRALGMA